ncbi:MAG: sulfur carrier protein ThiS [Myxococcaceae bacterium]|nr:sulfur carrier protein ThiS [Myxococcaceae bacterium]
MAVTVNGEPQHVPEGTSVAALLKQMNVSAEGVAVEVNAEVVRKARHTEVTLHNGDHIEIVTFVGGG